MNKKQFNIGLECLELNMLYVRLHTILIAMYCEHSKSAEYMTLLFKKLPEEWIDQTIDICEKYTKLRYNSKKKKCIINKCNKWNINKAISDTFNKQSNKSKERISPFKFENPKKIERILNRIQTRIDELNLILKAIPYIEPDFKKNFENRDTDKDLIREYLKQNPVKDLISSHGLPQSKYRYGTFGLGSMEFDAWSRNLDK
jgi:gas vesicle protein